MKGDVEPAVVAFFDEAEDCHRLAGSFEEFVGGLTRREREYVYAPQGAIGKAVDGLVTELNDALGVDLREYEDRLDVYTAVHPRWRTAGGQEATVEMRVNAVKGVGDGKRVAMFPETWSYRVLHCDVAPVHRGELEEGLARSGTKWVRVHGPVERLVGDRFYG
jgi:hypothetical protein